MKIRILPALLALLACAGCSHVRQGDAALTGIGTGAIGYLASDGDLFTTAASATAGYAARVYAQQAEDKRQQTALAKAYYTGEAKATRDLYEAIQKNQRVDTTQADKPAAEETKKVYIPITAPRRVINGVVIEPTVEYVPLNSTD